MDQNAVDHRSQKEYRALSDGFAFKPETDCKRAFTN